MPQPNSGPAPATPGPGAAARFLRTSGQLEAAKWLAFASMALDHVGKMFHCYSNNFYTFGRMAAPLFVLVLVDGILSSTDPVAACRRVTKRLLIVGVISQPITFIGFHDPWWYLNMMFTLAAATLVLELALTRRFAAKAWLLLLTPIAVYGLGAALLPLAVLLYRRNWQFGLLAGLACLWLMNPTLYGMVGGLLAFTTYYLLTQVSPVIPRLKHFFYAAYPVHLALLKLISVLT